MSKMMVKHNNFGFSKRFPPESMGCDPRTRSNTVAIDNFPTWAQWMKILADEGVLANLSLVHVPVMMGLSVVKHEEGDQFVRRTGYREAIRDMRPTSLQVQGLYMAPNGDLQLHLTGPDHLRWDIEVGPRGRMMILTVLTNPDSLYRRLYPEGKKDADGNLAHPIV